MRFYLGLCALCLLVPACVSAVPMRTAVAPRAMTTPAPRYLPRATSHNDIFTFYAPEPAAALEQERRIYKRDDALEAHADAEEDTPTPSKRSDVPSVPLSSLGPPTFPAQYPSCVKCQEKYSSISSCMQASSVFQNATSIFNDPINYIAVIKCACTDTFQAVYPQCVDCFQHTDQCWYLGTDPEGTNAPSLVTNMRQICGFGSALLGGVASANYPNTNGTFTPTAPGIYTDVTATGPGYYDQATGAIFSGADSLLPPLAKASTLTGMAALLGALFLSVAGTLAL